MAYPNSFVFISAPETGSTAWKLNGYLSNDKDTISLVGTSDVSYDEIIEVEAVGASLYFIILAKKGTAYGFATLYDDDILREKSFKPQTTLEASTLANFHLASNRFVFFSEIDIAVSNTAAKMVLYGKDLACYPGDGVKLEGKCKTCSKSILAESCTGCITEGEKLQGDGTCLLMTLEKLKQFQIILVSSKTYTNNETAIATFSEDIDSKYNVSSLIISTAPVAKNTDPLAEYNGVRRRRLGSIGVDNTLENLIFTNLTLIKNEIILQMDTSYMDSDFTSAIKLNVPPSGTAGNDDASDPSVMFGKNKEKAFWFFPLYFPNFNYSLADSYKTQSNMANTISTVGLWIGRPMILIVSGRGF